MLRGYRRRRASLAWWTARLTKTDPRYFPELSDVTGEPSARRRMTVDEIDATLSQWVVATAHLTEPKPE